MTVNPTLQRELFTPGGHLYVILDGASVPGILNHLHEYAPEHICLYREELLPNLLETAPYLVRLERDSRFTHWLLSQGWGKHWGIFARVGDQVSLKQVRQHFRTFLKVEHPDGQFKSFRYFDPRVLKVYLPTCNEAETQAVFGPVIEYIAEDKVTNRATRFTVKKGLPYDESVRLD